MQSKIYNIFNNKYTCSHFTNGHRESDVLAVIIDDELLENHHTYITENLPRLFCSSRDIILYEKIIFIVPVSIENTINKYIVEYDSSNIYTVCSKIKKTKTKITIENRCNYTDNILEEISKAVIEYGVRNILIISTNKNKKLFDLMYPKIMCLKKNMGRELTSDVKITTMYHDVLNDKFIDECIISSNNYKNFLRTDHTKTEGISREIFVLKKMVDDFKDGLEMDTRDQLQMIENLLMFYNIDLELDNTLKKDIIDLYNDIIDILNESKLFVNNIRQHTKHIEIIKSTDWMLKYVSSVYNNLTLHYYKSVNKNEIFEGYASNLITTVNKIKNKTIKNKLVRNISNNFKKEYDVEKLFTKDDFMDAVIDEYEILKINDTLFKHSIDSFHSSISYSNWFDEIKIGGSMGMLIKVNTSDLAKIGIDLSKLEIQQINATYYPSKDYIESVNDYFKTKKNFGILNNQEIISGRGIGSANSIIPLYINKHHWHYAKKHSPLIYGMTVAHNPFSYIEQHMDFIFFVLMQMIDDTYNNTILCIPWIRTLFALFRTCSEIAYERKYNRGIKNIIKKELNIQKKYPYELILSQILSSGYKLTIEHSKIFSDKYTDMFKDNTSKSEKFKKTFQVFNKFAQLIDDLCSKFGGFSKLLNMIDNKYGAIDDDLCEYIKKKIINK